MENHTPNKHLHVSDKMSIKYLLSGKEQDLMAQDFDHLVSLCYTHESRFGYIFLQLFQSILHDTRNNSHITDLFNSRQIIGGALLATGSLTGIALEIGDINYILKSETADENANDYERVAAMIKTVFDGSLFEHVDNICDILSIHPSVRGHAKYLGSKLVAKNCSHTRKTIASFVVYFFITRFNVFSITKRDFALKCNISEMSLWRITKFYENESFSI